MVLPFPLLWSVNCSITIIIDLAITVLFCSLVAMATGPRQSRLQDDNVVNVLCLEKGVTVEHTLKDMERKKLSFPFVPLQSISYESLTSLCSALMAAWLTDVSTHLTRSPLKGTKRFLWLLI